MAEILLLISEPSPQATRQVVNEVQNAGGRVIQRYGSLAFIVDAATDAVRAAVDKLGIAEKFTGVVPEPRVAQLDETARMGVEAWNSRHSPSFAERKATRFGRDVSWGHPDFAKEGRPWADDPEKHG